MFSFHHVAISVTDLKKSISFYSLFGYEEVGTRKTSDKIIVHMKLGDNFLELFRHDNPVSAPGHTRQLETDLSVVGVRHFALKVKSLIDAKKMVEEKGYKLAKDITEGRTGIQFFFVKDPDGLLLEIVQDDRDL